MTPAVIRCTTAGMERTGYMTKYALTAGIKTVHGTAYGDWIYVKASFGNSIQLREGRDFFEREEDAVANARERARKQIKLIDRQRKKLEKLALEPKWEV